MSFIALKEKNQEEKNWNLPELDRDPDPLSRKRIPGSGFELK